MADTAQVGAINTALFQVGKAPVVDLSDNSLAQSQAAAKLMSQIEISRDKVLRRHGWLCALTYSCLAPAVIANDDNWKYCNRFLLPGGALRVWEVRLPTGGSFIDEIDLASFGLVGQVLPSEAWESGTIDTPQGPRMILRANHQDMLALSFTRRASWSALDTHVLDAIAFDCAARCAWNITGDRDLASDLKKEAEAQTLMAISVDSTQEGGQPALAPSNTARIRAISR